MATKEFLLYLLTGFALVIVSVYYVNNYSNGGANPYLLSTGFSGSEPKVWPELKMSWRIVVASLIGFMGSACGTVGGVGGGGIFVPMLTLILGFDTKSAAALSKCMIMGASASSVWYNMRVGHPCRKVPIIDYDLALLFQPMLMLGITFGVSLSLVFPFWLITLLIIFLFIGTSLRSLAKGISMWKAETVLKNAQRETEDSHATALIIDADYEQLAPVEKKTTMQIVRDNLNTKRILALLILWVCFLVLQVIKNGTEACSTFYWLLNLLQLPIAVAVSLCKCCELYKEGKKRRMEGNSEQVCEASIEWTVTSLALCTFCGVVGGTVGGLLGSGGGFILGPLLLEIGVIPQVASATATFVMMFSSSLSVVEFYLLKRFPVPYGLYLMGVSMLAGFGGQFLVRKIVTFLGRASIIVFILSTVIFASALVMGIVGIEKSITMMNNHEFMGFLDFCSAQ